MKNSNNSISKINKGVSVIKTLRHSLPRKSVITIYKAFMMPLIDYDISMNNLKGNLFVKKFNIYSTKQL